MKSNARTLTRTDEGSAVACRRCTSLTQGTTSVELAGGVERTTTAKTEALVPRAYVEVGCGRETPLQGGVKHESNRCCEARSLRRRRERASEELDAFPPEGWRKPEVLLQGSEREVDVPPQSEPEREQTRGWVRGTASAQICFEWARQRRREDCYLCSRAPGNLQLAHLASCLETETEEKRVYSKKKRTLKIPYEAVSQSQ